MKLRRSGVALAVLLLASVPVLAAAPAADDAGAPNAQLLQELEKPMTSITHGSVTVEGKAIAYEAVAGTLVVNGTGNAESTPEVAMSYFAYFKQGANPAQRPITFVYNGGPGYSTIFLHMGPWGPKRVVTSDHSHTPAAPYPLVNNDYSLLDASDLVFIDMPGTGFGRLLPQGKDAAARARSHKELARKIWGVDGDGHAFARFITQFLSRFDRWNSPKYLYGESYGTTRSAVLAADLETEDNVDLNGVILQSQILDFATSVDGADRSPGNDLPYVLALPTYAATAWYHHLLPKYDQGGLRPLLDAATAFATGDYQQALAAGSTLAPAKKQDIAAKLHELTGLPVAYLLKADLRVTGGMFEHELQTATDTTTGRYDTRYSGPSMDPLAEQAGYDPQSASIDAAYIATFNDYVRTELKFGAGMSYRPMVYGLADDFHWDNAHKAPGSRRASRGALNVLPDLATAMKYNPQLKVMLNSGFYDLATPFYAATYEEQHLPIPASLRGNITYAYYPAGHMIYAHVPSLKALHDNVARFIAATDNLSR